MLERVPGRGSTVYKVLLRVGQLSHFTFILRVPGDMVYSEQKKCLVSISLFKDFKILLPDKGGRKADDDIEAQGS